MASRSDAVVAETPVGSARLAEELQRALKYSRLEKGQVDELVKIVAGFEEAHVRPLKVFPKGIPVPDSIQVHTVLPATNLEALIQVLRNNARIETVQIFPRGIPVPDVFVAEIGLR